MSQKPTSPQISFTFSLEATQLILAGLAHLPLGQSRALYDAVEKGMNQQLSAHLMKTMEQAKSAEPAGDTQALRPPATGDAA